VSGWQLFMQNYGTRKICTRQNRDAKRKRKKISAEKIERENDVYKISEDKEYKNEIIS
jgi:adenylate kinase